MTIRPHHPILRRIAAATMLAAFLAGIPSVLLTFFWPIDLPTVDDLAGPGEPVVIKTLLLAVVWTCWALFSWAVLVEVAGVIRNRPSQVRLPFQRLAAYLITAITITATAPVAAPRGLPPAAAATPDASPHAPPAQEREDKTVQTHQTYVVQPRDTLWNIAERHLSDPMRYQEIAALNHGRTMTDGHTFTHGDWLRPGWTLHLPNDAGSTSPNASLRTHTVTSGDTLWDIAERHLDAGHRYKEIFRLNKNRPQAGGEGLTRPGVLEPDWRLILPERKREPRNPGHNRHQAAPPLTPSLAPMLASPPHGATPPPTGTFLHHDTESPCPATEPAPAQPSRHENDPPETATESAPEQKPATAASPDMVALPGGGMMAISFAAGVAVALAAIRLRRRRELTMPGIDEPISMPVPEPHPPTVRALERAFHQTTTDTGSVDDFAVLTSSFTTDPPALLQIGIRDQTTVSLSLAGVNLALTGPGTDDCLRAIVLGLLAQADQHRAEVIIPTADAEAWFGASIHTMADHLPGLRLTATLDAAIDHLEEQFVIRRRLLRDHDSNDIPALRETEPDEPLPALLLVATCPGGRPYLDTLMGIAAAFGAGAVLAGHSASGSVCTIDSDHTVTEATGDLARELRDATLFHLPLDGAQTTLRTLATAHGLPHESPKPSDSPGRPAGPQPPPPAPSTSDAPPVRFAILGSPTIEINGTELDLTGRAKALELFVLLAVHPTGLDREQICEHLWPDVEETLAGYRFHAALKDLRAALRTAADPDGKAATFIERSGTTYRIAPGGVDVDLWAMHRALADARTATSEETKTDALETVARLCRGPLGHGLRYEWLDQDHRWPLTVATVKALLQLGALHEHARRHERALEIYDQACALDPDMEAAARSAIRLLNTLGRTDEARLRARHLKARLDTLGVECSPETRALLDSTSPRAAS
ncbi:LysM peptidoglycan-binding domain-containing protein [Spongiactinospora sp. TRM90649]|uniref:LysM peptidoglycan-binding domain-containing protein n=1 Tax=Spongiactinospora sp. TRM90649 TaxID=3031114 RepID=UPI0023F6B364|nr:LysM peptidoglycan-binding domain-containing protein [Spongiactinospora sp. TRM90649]MDF5758419.1 LysM peptidoglycan-binding domain-containing protein [Spongiactinospora sp. TRM90649]